MVDVTTSARPYARAAFAIASENACLDQWQASLDRLAACVKDPKMTPVMHNPQLSEQQLLDVCLACASAPKDDQLWGNFLRLLVRKKRLALVPAVASLFVRAKVDAAGVLPVTIESAKPLEDAYLQRLLKRLETRFGHPLRHEIRLNPSLIDGVVIRMADHVIDASVRGRLQALRHKLMDSAIATQ